MCAEQSDDRPFEGRVGCASAIEFLAEPTRRFQLSRRDLLRGAIATGTASTLLRTLEVRADAFKPTAADQKRIGDEAAEKVTEKYREITDSRQRELKRAGGRLLSALGAKERGPWDYRFHVIYSPEVNAFALPGGNIFMFTGIMDRIKSDDELAAVTGHEMTHIRREHWAYMADDALKRSLIAGAGIAITRGGALAHGLAGLSNKLLNLKYSRAEEDEADAGGLQDMFAAGYDPHGMLDLFHMLQQANGTGGPPEFLSNHPLTEDRIRRTEERIADLQLTAQPQSKN